MLLAELGNRHVRSKIIRNDDRVLDMEAMIGTRKIKFSAVVFPPNFWNVAFSEEYEDEGEKHETTELTGSGNEFEVLSFVTTCLKELLRKDPDEIRFTAYKGDGPSRATIYRKLADKLLKGYSREEDHENGPEVEFRYVKKQSE